MTVSWDAPIGGLPPSDYNIQYRKGTAGVREPSWIDWPHDGDSRSAVITGLAIGTEYQIRVQALNRCGVGTYTTLTTQTAERDTSPTLPPIPNIRANLGTSFSYVLPEATGGNEPLTYSVESLASWLSFNASTRAISGQVPTTAGSDSATYRVDDDDDDFDTEAFTVIWQHPPPGAPRNLRVVGSPTMVSVSLDWDAPNTGGPISSYEVEYNTSLVSELTWVRATRTTTLTNETVSGLASNDLYRFRVRAVGVGGNGAWSPDVSARTATPVAPSAPRNVRETADTDTSITLSWDLPATGDAPTGYHIQYYKSGDASNVLVRTHVGIGRTNTISTLDPGTTYYVRVQASNLGGEGPWSSYVAMDTETGLPDPPGQLRNFGEDTKTRTSITVDWDAPNTGGTPAGYDVEYRVGTSGNWIRVRTGGLTRSQTITGLIAGGQYQIRGRATNAGGNSAWTTVTLTTTPPELPPGLISNLRETSDTSTSISFSWNAPTTGGSVTDYDIQYRLSGNSLRTWIPWSHIGISRSATITGLTAGRTYQVRVKADGPGGEGTWSGYVLMSTAIDAPGAISNLRETSDTETSVTISWNAPTTGGTPTGYDVEYFRTTIGLRSWPHSGVGRSATITGLESNTLYQVRVRATNSGGNGPWSGFVGVQTGAPPAPDPPGPVRNLRRFSTSSASLIQVEWDLPSTGGSVTSYNVQYRQGTSGSYMTLASSSVFSSIRRAIISGLTRDSSYQIRVSASGAGGDGPWRSISLSTSS